MGVREGEKPLRTHLLLRIKIRFVRDFFKSPVQPSHKMYFFDTLRKFFFGVFSRDLWLAS
ncbi:hypothetical protein DYH55_03905 [Methylovirgula sp. 4M-Z18]|nr:hypothetical protein DYH55_03905 [Methylovirgula sp. 4M-Z18]